MLQHLDHHPGHQMIERQLAQQPLRVYWPWTVGAQSGTLTLCVEWREGGAYAQVHLQPAAASALEVAELAEPLRVTVDEVGELLHLDGAGFAVTLRVQGAPRVLFARTTRLAELGVPGGGTEAASMHAAPSVL